MIQNYFEDDGRDPGLSDMAYDGTEYELDEFNERVGSDDMFMDDDEATDDAVMDDTTEPTPAQATDANLEDSFGETLSTENPHLADQLTDDNLHEAAKEDYPEAGAEQAADTATDPAEDKSIEV